MFRDWQRDPEALAASRRRLVPTDLDNGPAHFHQKSVAGSARTRGNGGVNGGAAGQRPERQRAALVLRFYADLPGNEIATILGCREGTVKSLIHRGLAKLREAVGE